MKLDKTLTIFLSANHHWGDPHRARAFLPDGDPWKNEEQHEVNEGTFDLLLQRLISRAEMWKVGHNEVVIKFNALRLWLGHPSHLIEAAVLHFSYILCGAVWSLQEYDHFKRWLHFVFRIWRCTLTPAASSTPSPLGNFWKISAPNQNVWMSLVVGDWRSARRSYWSGSLPPVSCHKTTQTEGSPTPPIHFPSAVSIIFPLFADER